MKNDDEEKAYRLEALTQRVGFALWQLQLLEAQSAIYFVLLKQATFGMGKAAGEALVDDAQEKTFGVTVKRLKNAGLLNTVLAERFDKLLVERNWLVHSSRFDCRAAVESGIEFQENMTRIDAMPVEASVLLTDVMNLCETFVKMHGITDEYIQREAQRQLEAWRRGED